MANPEAREPRLERVDGLAEGVVVLALSGELDIAAGPRFRELVQTAAQEAPDMVVIDLEEVGFMDSTMLRELLRAHREVAEAGGRMVVAAPQSSVQRLLELTGTADVFAVAASRDEALTSQS
jgi:stage II sporulation protein AA (anti-sigma F factor antagonist)